MDHTTSLLEQTYKNLHMAELVSSTCEFSADYLKRNRNWYAWQKHVGRDMGVAAAIQCLRSVRNQFNAPSLQTAQRLALEATADLLLLHLRKHHSIVDVCDPH